MADEHSVADFYDCSFCDKLAEHVPISAEEFGGGIFIPKNPAENPEPVFTYWRCCECGAVCQRRTDGKVSDQPGGNGCYIKYL